MYWIMLLATVWMSMSDLFFKLNKMHLGACYLGGVCKYPQGPWFAYSLFGLETQEHSGLGKKYMVYENLTS